MFKYFFFVLITGLISPQKSNAAIDCKKYPAKDIEECCTGVIFFPQNIEKKCNDTLGKKSDDVCMSDCLVTTSEIGAAGAVNQAKLKAFLQANTAKDATHLPIFEKAYQKCEPVAKDVKANVKVNSKCDTFGAGLIECVIHELWSECPANKFKAGAECNTAKDYFKSCSVPDTVKMAYVM